MGGLNWFHIFLLHLPLRLLQADCMEAFVRSPSAPTISNAAADSSSTRSRRIVSSYPYLVMVLGVSLILFFFSITHYYHHQQPQQQKQPQQSTMIKPDRPTIRLLLSTIKSSPTMNTESKTSTTAATPTSSFHPQNKRASAFPSGQTRQFRGAAHEVPSGPNPIQNK